jgi:serine protease AprX
VADSSNVNVSVNLPEKIYAEAVVRSVSGKSLLRVGQPIDSDLIDQFTPDPKLRDIAVERLLRAGFEILTIGKTSISIAGNPKLYEQVFNTKLETQEKEVLKSLGRREPATFINAQDTKPFGEIDISDTDWRECLEGVAIAEPAYYFSEMTPAAVPPAIAKKYLSVPDGVAEELNAKSLHQQGIDGSGVRIAMIDTGWYPHPFFRQNNFSAIPILTPGTSDRFVDEHGHGTGESANIFAVAPKAELVMVKAGIVVNGKHKNVSPIAAFETAIKLQPHIITCSWGSDLREKRLSPANRVLAAIVARAVSKGIIVIFSAGNGHWGFPGQHPDVIAVGGVYKHLDGSGKLEASNYASSFNSPIYAGRSVPDICGLVGQKPYADYIILPVSPDCEMDRVMAKVNDGTTTVDGWACFSGTSAAAPQVAGVCALIRQVAPKLTPEQVRKVLKDTAIDVVAGNSNSVSGGAVAGVGRDLATGAGLVDAAAAVKMARELDTGQCCDDCTSQSSSFSSSPVTSSNTQNNPRRKPMSSQFPKLKNKLDEIQFRLDQVLRDEFIDNKLIENVELRFTLKDFVERSNQSDAILSLVQTLKDLGFSNKKSKKIDQADISKITKKHVLAAQSLLKSGSNEKLATKVLIAATSSNNKHTAEKATEALGEFSLKVGAVSSFGDDCDDQGRCK